MILYTITKLSMPRIDQIINNENKWIFYDNKFSQFMVFNEDAIVSNKSLISKLNLIFQIFLAFLWISLLFIMNCFCKKNKLENKICNHLIFNFKENQSINKIFENNDFGNSYLIINLLSKKEILKIYNIKFKLLINNFFYSIKEVLKVHYSYSYPSDISRCLLTKIDKKIANYVILTSIFNGLEEDNIECKIYSGGAFFVSYASLKFNHRTYYYTHGLLGKLYKKLLPKFTKIYVFTAEEKRELENFQQNIDIQIYKYKKIENHNNIIIIYTRGVDDSILSKKNVNSFYKLINFFKSNNFKIYIKKHPYYTGSFFSESTIDFEVISNETKDNLLETKKPKYIVSWYSTVIAEALNSNIIPINLVNNNDTKLKFKETKIYDWIIYPILKKSLSWKNDQNKIINSINNKNYYKELIVNLINA